MAVRHSILRAERFPTVSDNCSVFRSEQRLVPQEVHRSSLSHSSRDIDKSCTRSLVAWPNTHTLSETCPFSRFSDPPSRTSFPLLSTTSRTHTNPPHHHSTAYAALPHQTRLVPPHTVTPHLPTRPPALASRAHPLPHRASLGSSLQPAKQDERQAMPCFPSAPRTRNLENDCDGLVSALPFAYLLLISRV